MNEAGVFTNWTADEQSNCSNDVEQFGQLLATLLGHCHGSSEYIKVNISLYYFQGLTSLVLRLKEIKTL